MKLYNLKVKNKLSMSCNNKEFGSINKKTDLQITNKKPIKFSNKYNLSTMNLNDIKISKTNENYFKNYDNYQDLKYMLYLQYIIDRHEKKESYKKKHFISEEKYKTVNKENVLYSGINSKKQKDNLIPFIGRNTINNSFLHKKANN